MHVGVSEIGVACTIMVADCLPVLLTHPDGGVVAAAHAGWRGLAGGVIEQTVSAMCQAKGLKAQHLSVWLGPCIGPTAFEVGDEVRQTFMQSDANMQRYFKAHPTHSNKWLADLAGMARARLAALGIQDIHGNDSTPAWCTVGAKFKVLFLPARWRHRSIRGLHLAPELSLREFASEFSAASRLSRARFLAGVPMM